MSTETGGAAFPRPMAETTLGGNFEQDGMTLRDYFAAKAMQGILAYPGCELMGSYHNNATPDSAAISAYTYADAMLKIRNKK